MNIRRFSKKRALESGAIAALLIGAAASFANAADTTQQRLESSDKEPQNWLLPHGNYEIDDLGEYAATDWTPQQKTYAAE